MDGIKEVGVEAVVKNLNGFLSDVRKMNKAAEGFSELLLEFGSKLSGVGIETFSDDILNLAGAFSNLHPAVYAVIAAIKLFKLFIDDVKRLANDVKRVFSALISVVSFLKDTFLKLVNIALKPVKSAFDFVVGSLRRVAEIASGILIAGTIRKLGQLFSDAATSAFEAALNFQTLEVRLQGLAARQFLNTGGVEDFTEALDMAALKSEELLDWVIELSLKAPLLTDAIANTLTLATSYGLGEQAAKDMTTAVLTFASGMGLTDLAQRRIIENFGQMIQQGKITSMELRDMGRGAFVPVNDLLTRTAELLGMTADQFDGTAGSINKFATKAGLDPTMAIMQAFIELTEEEFPGAIERMGQTIQGLRQRFKNLVGSVVGLNILQPSLDLLGQTIGRMFDAFAESDDLKFFTENIGFRLRDIVEGLLENLPPVETILETVTEAIATFADALQLLTMGDYMGALREIGVPESILNFIDKIVNFKETKLGTFIEGLITKFERLRDFWDENKETIMEALRVAAGEILSALGIDASFLEQEDPMENFLKFKESGDDWDVQPIIDNIENITEKVVGFIDTVRSLPETIETMKPWLAVFGISFLALRYPILAVGALITGFPLLVGFAMAAAIGKIIEYATLFYNEGKNLAQSLWSGFTEWWRETAVPWLTNAMNAIIKFLPSGLGKFLMGDVDLSEATPTSIARPNRSSIINNKITLNANYSQTQSPVTIADDMSVLLSKIGP